MKIYKFVLIAAIVFAASVTGFGQSKGSGIWSRVDASRVQQMVVGAAKDLPSAFSAYHLDVPALRVVLAQSPEEFKSESLNILQLPMPDGSLQRFRVEHSLVVEPGLLEKFPELGATYRGYGIDDPTAFVRFDLLPSGFHAMILRAGTSVYVNPYGSEDIYISFEKTAAAPRDEFVCHTNDLSIDDIVRTTRNEKTRARPEVISGATLRTYRLALAATGEYTQFTGGTVATALAAQVLTMNRVNGVYERDLAIHMNIVENNNLVIYTNGSTDPYTNNNGSTMLTQNTTNLNNVIGTTNYDIGHVFSTGGGGVATLNGPCGTNKARGVTGSSAPVGDPFDIDYVAHEMGHQWGGNHTFNSTTSNCGGGNRSASAAYEPGSGITIMAYAGICGNQNLAPNSIDTFHVKSLEEIVNYSQNLNGNTCAVPTATGNTPPSNIVVGGPYTIPMQTPFALTATAADVNGDQLTYDWQEYDLGGSTTAVPNSDSDSNPRPIFRPYLPSPSGTRYFPSLQYILNNGNVPPASFTCGGTSCLTGEILPSMTRTMNFQVVVRDNRVGGGGINSATVQVNVTSTRGPLLVTSPNTAISVNGGSPFNVTWQVADTNLSPVNATNVDILLSTDGGLTFPTTLLANTPNDGSESVAIPNTATSTARIKVQASGNIFFDISNTNFTITASAVTLSGRVMAAEGRGVKGTSITLADPNGGTTTVRTNSKGFFTFTNVPAGITYTLTVLSPRFTYTPQTVIVGGSDITNLLPEPV